MPDVMVTEHIEERDIVGLLQPRQVFRRQIPASYDQFDRSFRKRAIVPDQLGCNTIGYAENVHGLSGFELLFYPANPDIVVLAGIEPCVAAIRVTLGWIVTLVYRSLVFPALPTVLVDKVKTLTAQTGSFRFLHDWYWVRFRIWFR